MKHPFSRFFGFGEKEDTAEKTTGIDTEEIDDSVYDEVKKIPVADIVPNRFQPRTVFADEKIEELSLTIHTHGIIQPIVVRQADGNYEIIAGERRFRAVLKLGWETIPAIIKENPETS